MARLTARAAAEMLNLPAYEQLRILHEQKHPKQQPQSFRAPFYLPTLSAIRNFYRSGRNFGVLKDACADIARLGLEARRENNLRALSQFETSDQCKRALEVATNSPALASIGAVEVRLSADMRAIENDKPKVVFYTCRGVALDAEIARKTLEIGHWILETVGEELPPQAFEFVDLQTKKVYRLTRPSPSTIRLLRLNARAIEAMRPNV